MLRTMVLIGLLGTGLAPAYAEAPSSATQTPDRPTVAPDKQSDLDGKRADSSTPRSGVIQPAPDAGRGTTVMPPNVDPAMTIPPPGTPGGNPRVDPK